MEILKKVNNIELFASLTEGNPDFVKTYEQFLQEINSPFFSLSASALSRFTTPLNFALEKMSVKDDPTAAMLQGSLLHCLILEPQNFHSKFVVFDGEQPRSEKQKIFVNCLICNPFAEATKAWAEAYQHDAKATLDVLMHDYSNLYQIENDKIADQITELYKNYDETMRKIDNDIVLLKIEHGINTKTLTEKELADFNKAEQKLISSKAKEDKSFQSVSKKLAVAREKAKLMFEKARDKAEENYNKTFEKANELALKYDDFIKMMQIVGKRIIVSKKVYDECLFVSIAIKGNYVAISNLNKCSDFEKRIDFSYQMESGRSQSFVGFADGFGYDKEKNVLTILDLKKRVTADPKRLKYDITNGDIGIQLAIYALGLIQQLQSQGVIGKYFGLANCQAMVLSCDMSGQTSVVYVSNTTLIEQLQRLDEKLNNFEKCIETESWGQSFDFHSENKEGVFFV
jgi:hypothetical protein